MFGPQGVALAVPALASVTLDNVPSQHEPLFIHWHSVWHVLVLVSTAYATAFVLPVQLAQLIAMRMPCSFAYTTLRYCPAPAASSRDTPAERRPQGSRCQFRALAAAVVLPGIKPTARLFQQRAQTFTLEDKLVDCYVKCRGAGGGRKGRFSKRGKGGRRGEERETQGWKEGGELGGDTT
jgi:hypothetical protein